MSLKTITEAVVSFVVKDGALLTRVGAGDRATGLAGHGPGRPAPWP